MANPLPEWLRDAPDPDEVIPLQTLLFRIASAMVAGFIVAIVYHFGLGRRKSEPTTLPTTLVLLTVIIALVTQVIGDSVARAFGLVGALSIVRFRTVVEDTRDTAFVIFAVVVGMGIGAGYQILILAGIPAVLIAALVMLHGWRDDVGGVSLVTVRFGLGPSPDEALREAMRKHATSVRLVGTATAKNGAALEATYRVRLREATAAFNLVADLNRVEGVQGVELRGS